jgi:hypothetical protein
VVGAIVGDGVVEPDVGVALDAGVDPLHIALVDHVDDGVAGPHDAGRTDHIGAKGRQIGVVGTGVGFVVLGWAEDEGLDVGMYLAQGRVKVVDELGLIGGILSHTGDVVEEDGELPHAEVIDALQLVLDRNEVIDDAVVVGVVPRDGIARMDGPYEAHLIVVGGLDKFL